MSLNFCEVENAGVQEMMDNENAAMTDAADADLLVDFTQVDSEASEGNLMGTLLRVLAQFFKCL